MEEFHKCVPKEALPTEYGGTAGDMDTLHGGSSWALETSATIDQY